MMLVGTSCNGPTPSKSTSSKVEWIDPNEIHPSPIVHDSLPIELVARIKNVHQTFADVDGTPLEKWIEDFRRDLNPEPNVRIWEDMQTAYTQYCNGRDLPLETRKEVFKVVLLRSMMPPTDVLTQIEPTILTEEQVTEIMNGYPSPPKPLEVVQTGP